MKRLMMNGKVIEISATITCFILLIGACCLLLMWSEYEKDKCIEKGGRVIDTAGPYDSCVYGGE